MRFHVQNPFSLTPIRNSKESLLLGSNMEENLKEIAKFSKRDAEVHYRIYSNRTPSLIELHFRD